jgi:hypothetical protein
MADNKTELFNALFGKDYANLNPTEKYYLDLNWKKLVAMWDDSTVSDKRVYGNTEKPPRIEVDWREHVERVRRRKKTATTAATE